MQATSRAQLAAILLLAVLNAPLLAGGILRDSVGARASGRGGTNLGFADNGQMLLDNPGAMTNLPQTELFELGGDLLLTDLEYADADNATTDAADHPFPAGQISYVRRSEDGLWAYGLGIYSVAGFSARYDLVAPASFGSRHQYKSIGMVAKILPGAAVRLTERLSLGATFGLAGGHIELEGPYYLQHPGPLRGTPLMLDLQTTGVAPTWSVGLQYQLTEKTTLGFAYQSEVAFELDGHAEVAITGMGSSHYDTQLAMVLPQTLGLGVTHHVCKHHTLAADVVWYQWSAAFDQFQLHFRNPSNGLFPEIEETFPLNWQDTVAVRTGYEYRPDRRCVYRLGYIHHPNPIPASTLTPYLQTTQTHTVSIGYGWITAAAVEIDLAYQHVWGSQTHVAHSALAGGDFDASQHHTRAHWLSFSVMRRY